MHRHTQHHGITVDRGNHMTHTDMLYITAARGIRPATVPIVMEVQMLVCPGFKKLNEQYGFDGICKNAELSAQCTVMPVTDLGVDAAIHMSDAFIPVEAMGLEIQHTLQGPRIADPIRTPADVERLCVPEPEEAMSVWLNALRIAKAELMGKAPLIGWIAAPLNTASFMVEGGLPTGPTPYDTLKTMMYTDPHLLHRLLDTVTTMYVQFINAQIDAGADIIMALDLKTPAALCLQDYREFAFPYIQKIARAVQSRNVPLLFGSDGATFLHAPFSDLGVDVIALDWTVDMGDAIQKLGPDQVVQGNLDPHCLLAPESIIEDRVKEIIDAGTAAPAHIFSLGGWVLMHTPFEKVRFLVDLVHSL